MNHTYDAIVIGCGGFGSSALFHLAARGMRVLGIDRWSPPHQFGSSHGETRIIRKAYFEHPGYVPLLHRAWDLWENLSRSTGQALLEKRPLVMTGGPGSEVVSGAMRSASLHQLPLDCMTAEEGQRLFPMFRIPEHHSVAVERSAGFLRAEKCIQAHLDGAADNGAEFRFDEPVLEWRGCRDSIEITTPSAKFSAGAVVMTSGPWTASLLPEYQKLIRIRRKVLFWYPVSSPVWSDPVRSAVFLMDLPDGQFYGIPSVDGATMKVAEHTGGEAVADPTRVDRVVRETDESPVSTFVRNHLNFAEPTARRSSVCMYSDSPDGHFLIDRHSEFPLVVAAGFSGHGFKFTSVLGEVAADLVQRNTISFDLQFLSANRFHASVDQTEIA